MDNKSKILLLLILIILGLLALFANSFTGKSIDSAKLPSPRVIDVQCEKFYTDSIPQIELTANLRNFGDEGKVIITGEIDAIPKECNSIQKKEIYLEKGESKEIKFYFEVEKIIDAKCFARATLP